MNRLLRFTILPALCFFGTVFSADDAAIMFSRPDMADVRSELMQWIARSDADPQVRETVIADWTDDGQLARLSDEDLLDLLVESFAAADVSTQRLLESSAGAGPLEQIIYDGIRDLDIYHNHIELFRARWMTQHRLFDEALEIYDRILPDRVVDPAGMFFYRAVCQSELFRREAALDSLSLLLNHTLQVPPRFRTVAMILQKELSGRSADDLGHVARLMADVKRQLDLGRSGERVQERQVEVIDAIDHLLEEAENKQNNDQQQGQGQNGQQTPNQPSSGRAAPNSRIHGSPGKGEADSRELKETGSWGMLDRRREVKARELIRQQFPANYLDIISKYSQRIAEQN